MLQIKQTKQQNMRTTHRLLPTTHYLPTAYCFAPVENVTFIWRATASIGIHNPKGRPPKAAKLRPMCGPVLAKMIEKDGLTLQGAVNILSEFKSRGWGSGDGRSLLD